jgi:hypothetical protein
VCGTVEDLVGGDDGLVCGVVGDDAAGVLDGEHLLDGLPGYPELPGDLGLRDALLREAADQVAALAGQVLGDPEVLESHGADLFETADGVLLGGAALG